jgi:hypothetical protein
VSRQGASWVSAQGSVLEAWFEAEHAAAGQECGVPKALVYTTKAPSALELRQAAVRRGSLPFRWVAAAERDGDSPAVREGVAAREGKGYVTQIKDTPVLGQTRPEGSLPAGKGHGPPPTRLQWRAAEDSPLSVQDLLNGLPTAAWTRATLQEGSPGPIVGDCAVLRVVEARSG